MFCIGVDVGGTNTDSCVIDAGTKKVLTSAKTATTADVSTGIVNAIQLVLKAQPVKPSAVMIGTTHFGARKLVCAFLDGLNELQ